MVYLIYTEEVIIADYHLVWKFQSALKIKSVLAAIVILKGAVYIYVLSGIKTMAEFCANDFGVLLDAAVTTAMDAATIASDKASAAAHAAASAAAKANAAAAKAATTDAVEAALAASAAATAAAVSASAATVAAESAAAAFAAAATALAINLRH